MQNLKPTPRLTGTMSLWDFTGKLIEIIEAEPKRLYMDDVVTAFLGKDVFGERADEADDMPALPECGTVACIAGWTNVLTRTTDRFGDLGGIGHAARTLCGHASPSKLTWTGPELEMEADLEECFYTVPDLEVPLGTPEYIEVSLAPFKAWREKYADVLKAREVHLGE